ncbi:hypothetical protein BC834DRAFT_1043555 [Gloeopeniophorella convolvens]|nr:hypothetical protein BC834DRAFT_1043555 [Gloeopeniophorella convolvens]
MSANPPFHSTAQRALPFLFFPLNSPIDKVIKGLNELGYPAQPGDLARLAEHDGTESALETIASVRAYFQVAYKRFVDNVPMGIDRTLLRGAVRELEKVLYDGLEIDGPAAHERCTELLGEASGIREQRAVLSHRRERLEKAKGELVEAFT